MQSMTAAYKRSWPGLSEPKSCISSVLKKRKKKKKNAPSVFTLHLPPLPRVRSLAPAHRLLYVLIANHRPSCLFVFVSLRASVLRPPVQPHITQLKNVTAVEGSAAMISCVADGEPLPDISWRRASDGQTFVDGDKVGGDAAPEPLGLRAHDSKKQMRWEEHSPAFEVLFQP